MRTLRICSRRQDCWCKMGGGYRKQVVSCIVAQESILVFLIHSFIRLCSSWQYLINFSKKCGLSEFFLEGNTVGGKWVVAIKIRWCPALLQNSRFYRFSLIRSKVCVLLSSILLIFRKNADSANFFSKVGLLGEKWVVEIKIRWCPALLEMSRFHCFSFICS